MTWLKPHLPWLIAATAVFLLLGSQGWWSGKVSEHETRAEIAEAEADSSTARADALRDVADSLAEAYSEMAETYAADSARWQDRDRENRAQIASLTRRASTLADSLRSTLDDAGRALLAEYEAQTDSVLALKDERIADLESEVTSLWTQRETLGEAVATLEAENDELRDANESLRDARASLESALSSQKRKHWAERGIVLAGVVGLALLR